MAVLNFLQHFETHDRKTGEVIRINPDDDKMTLGEMLRQEKFGAGMADQKNLDAQFARAVMADGKFQVCYISAYLLRFLIQLTERPRLH